MDLNPGSYVTVQAWMRSELGLSGNELLAYALIYGFSQDGFSRFEGTASYVAEWCGISQDAAIRILNRLTSKGLLTKEERRDGRGHKRCSYAAAYRRNIARPTDDSSVGPTDESSVKYSSNKYSREINNPYSPLVAEVIDKLNSATGCAYKATTKETAKTISGRLSEGYTVDDFKAVIDAKVAEWGSDPTMRKYLTPKTLFRQSNFERYVNALKVSPTRGVDFSGYDA